MEAVESVPVDSGKGGGTVARRIHGQNIDDTTLLIEYCLFP